MNFNSLGNYLLGLYENFNNSISQIADLFAIIPYFNLILLVMVIFFAYHQFSIFSWLLIGLLIFIQFQPDLVSFSWYIILTMIVGVPIFRRNLITLPIFLFIKAAKLIPNISQTELTALKSGTVWVDGQLFSGKPNFKKIFAEQYPTLSRAEKDFINNEVEELCKISKDEEIYEQKNLPVNVWKYLKENKFFGIIIPKKYGGLEFSAFGHSEIIQKLSSRSAPLAITAMVPNSLGPAELLLHYGTDEQRDYYLPRLANGTDIPCFALTEPNAGSDATSITSHGVLFKDHNDDIKIKLNWTKRYITLGAVATVIGLAFKLKDPENLLGMGSDLGINCALIPNQTKGVIQGRRHDPLSTPFINSPIDGKDVIVGLDAIIGGKDGVGKGWEMLMESLAAGRGISLPSTSCGGAKMVARYIANYASIRQQFGLPIAKFGSIEKVLAKIFSKTYILDALRCFTAGAVDSGAKPAVVSAIAKYHSTEMFRNVTKDAMDIAAGAGIIRGKRNILSNAYFSAPIGVTVEGANIITRSLIQFGQGAIMCHPFLYRENEALQNNDLIGFDLYLSAHLGYILRNKIRMIFLSLTRGYCHIPTKMFGISAQYERKLSWVSASFAYFADLAIIRFGGDIKRQEKINARFGDILSNMYLAVCVLKKFQFENKSIEEEKFIRYILDDIFADIDEAFSGIFKNLFPNKILGLINLPFIILFKLNPFSFGSKDSDERKIADQYCKSGYLKDKLTKGIYIPNDVDEVLGRLENALDLYEKTAEPRDRIKKAIKNKKLPKLPIKIILDDALRHNIISQEEFDQLQESEA
ncbi:acyl-CoA dehydrogenase, partial [Rickettsiales bacterium]|nr:acyl-CoA dehydrogenase [Rickettsiales bacterium]